MVYKKGDIVKVWSLQSFHGGGFLDGVQGIVYQDQIGSSVLVSVVRVINGNLETDPSYEVYSKQLEFIERPKLYENQKFFPFNTIFGEIEKLKKEINELKKI